MIRPSIVDITDTGQDYHPAIIDTLLAGGPVSPGEVLFIGAHPDLFRTHKPEPMLVELAVVTALNLDAVEELLQLEWLVGL